MFRLSPSMNILLKAVQNELGQHPTHRTLPRGGGTAILWVDSVTLSPRLLFSLQVTSLPISASGDFTAWIRNKFKALSMKWGQIDFGGREYICSFSGTSWMCWEVFVERTVQWENGGLYTFDEKQGGDVFDVIAGGWRLGRCYHRW